MTKLESIFFFLALGTSLEFVKDMILYTKDRNPRNEPSEYLAALMITLFLVLWL